MTTASFEKISQELKNALGNIERFRDIYMEDLSINYDSHNEAADFYFDIDNEQDEASIRKIINDSLNRRVAELKEQIKKELE